MSIDGRVPKCNGDGWYEVKLEAYVNEPWAAAGAYLALLEQAKLHGLEDIDGVYIVVELHVSGRTYERRVLDLETRMEQMAMGELEVTRFKELKNG